MTGRVRGVAGQAAVVLGRREVGLLHRKLVLDLLMAARAERPRPSMKKRRNGATVGLMTGGAVPGRDGWMHAAAGRSRGFDLMALGADVADLGRHEVLCFGSMGGVTGCAISVGKREMLVDVCHRSENRLVALAAQGRAFGLEEPVGAGVGQMTRRAIAGRHWRMDHRKAGAATHAGVAFAAQFFLGGHQETADIGSVGAMTVKALAGRRRVHGLRARGLGVLMTLDAQLARLGAEKRPVLGRVPAVAGRTLAGHGVNARLAEGIAHVVVALDAQIAFGSDQERPMVGCVGAVAVEARSFRCRVVE